MFFSRFKLIKSGFKFSLIFLLVTQVNAYKPLWQSKEYIKKSFFEIAYNNEYSKEKSKLRRWEKPIKYRVDYFNLPPKIEMVETLIDEHFKDLSSIINLPITKDDKNPNFRIVLTKKSHYKDAISRYMTSKVKNIENESNCLLSFRHKAYQLIGATVIIPVDHAMRYGLLPACVVEELTQAMGLPNDSDWVNPSVANDKSILDLLTGLDYLMLKILYDKRLVVGLDVGQSSAIVDTILFDFEQQNLIKNSVLKSRELRLSKQLE